MDRMFEQDWRTMESAMSGMRGSSGRNRSDESNLTLQEEKGDYRVTADLPGVKEGDLDVSLDGRLLRISAPRGSTNEATADNGEVVRREAYSSGMQWAFTLPGPVDVSKMHTDLSDGVLTVTIPKAKS